MSGKRSKNSDYWYKNGDNLLKHCGKGHRVFVNNPVAQDIKKEVQSSLAILNKLNDFEKSKYKALSDYLLSFDDDKCEKTAKDAAETLLPILKAAYENEPSSRLTTFVTKLLNELRNRFESNDWDAWVKRVSQKEKDSKRTRVTIEREVMDFLDERQAFFGEKTRQSFLDKLGDEYEICSASEVRKMNFMIRSLKKSRTHYRNILNELEELGMLDSTTRLLLVNGIKVQKGQKYELGETTPVEDGKDKIVKQLKPIENGVDKSSISSKRLKKKKQQS
jgi:hypothetical protein